MNGESLAGLILIIQNQITSQAMKTVELFSFKVEIFQVCFLHFFSKTFSVLFCLNILNGINVPSGLHFRHHCLHGFS